MRKDKDWKSRQPSLGENADPLQNVEKKKQEKFQGEKSREGGHER